ncbi:hypothetical protein PFICI_08605 [Pestalotiopsis fici W106-1]|uniref:Uncharacterized protein n=1 Tax=Pestalotiopsis fici (strain W106-1 / CGMCC3.15140) TaxID=1229662 RepID=W3X079_PESFW|nr:uncharacterized protein PFICI_08605 [Pestalotiopsis fici W106-1]ETS78752.1 hypothetical protein PFICI_08605 [Pestalotiopsis fici W106-1]
MATKTSIPRFLLPQYGAIWRTTARTMPFPRPASLELGQVLVRYASKTVAASKTTATKSATTASKTAAAKKVEAPKAASTKAAASKVSSVKAAASKPAAAASKTSKTPAAKASAAKGAAPKLSSTPDPTAPRKAVTPDPSKPLVLEKPERFNPPSHGARLPRSTPKHYGGAPTFEEVQAQKTREYPGLPPPPNTWSHWFINNRHIHMFITLGTLVSLTAYTFAAKFNATSPYAEMIPPISEFPSHPIDYIGTCFHVLRLHEEHISAVTAEKRRRKVDDVAKRNEYRKAHGLDAAQGIESWNAPAKEVAPVAAEVEAPSTAPVAEQAQATPEVSEDGKRKKFLGIF